MFQVILFLFIYNHLLSINMKIQDDLYLHNHINLKKENHKNHFINFLYNYDFLNHIYIIYLILILINKHFHLLLIMFYNLNFNSLLFFNIINHPINNINILFIYLYMNLHLLTFHINNNLINLYLILDNIH